MTEAGDRPDKTKNWDTPEYWLECAKEAQAMADGCADPAVRNNMTKVAEGCRRMAEQATVEVTAAKLMRREVFFRARAMR